MKMSGVSSSFLTKSIILLALVIVAFGGSTYFGKELGRKIMDVTRSNLETHSLMLESSNQGIGIDDVVLDIDGRDTFGFDSDNFGNNRFPREWADPEEGEFETVSEEPGVVINLLDPPSHNIDNGGTQDPQHEERPIVVTDTGTDEEDGDVIYRIQVGTFSERENAENVWESLIQADYDASISTYTDSDRVMYRVQVGMYQDRLEADRHAEELRSMNFDAWVYQLS